MTTAPDPDAWMERSRAALQNVKLAPETESFGRVERAADGVAFVSGLPDVRLGEVLTFSGGHHGFAMTLSENEIATILLDDTAAIPAGSHATAKGHVLQTPVGEGLLGRVIDPLGRPLDGKGAIPASQYWPVEQPAPAIIDRALVSDMLETGVLVLDGLFTIGRGQRELIIGDRATGKTSLAVDAMINQKDKGVICVYVALGQRMSSIERVIDAVTQHGDLAHTIFVVAPASSSPGLQWIAPFAGMTIAEYFRASGGHALVVIDDLSKHAATHRELALLTREPPGREAYPGDIFYLHARLLERAAKLSPEKGGGSLTVLPIAETDAGNLAAYIPTNLISITDGQIVLDARLFAANQRPAVHVGLRVSRVGGKAQDASLRAVSARVRLDYAQCVELESFARLGGVTQAGARARLLRGERLRALFSQPRFANLRMVDQVALLLAAQEGDLDALPITAIAPLRAQLPELLNAQASAMIRTWSATTRLTQEGCAELLQHVRDLIGELANHE
jgi:F-type H+-transporting ATPase subunit alpha